MRSAGGPMLALSGTLVRMNESPLDDFMIMAEPVLSHRQERERLQALLLRWTAAWTGPNRALNLTASNHGAYLHFSQRFGSHWMQAFTFHATRNDGVALKGPDPDRGRKSHKLRTHRLDPKPLDDLFEAWSAHPEARPAGLAVAFHLEETPDETWAELLREARTCLGA